MPTWFTSPSQIPEHPCCFRTGALDYMLPVEEALEFMVLAVVEAEPVWFRLVGKPSPVVSSLPQRRYMTTSPSEWRRSCILSSRPCSERAAALERRRCFPPPTVPPRRGGGAQYFNQGWGKPRAPVKGLQAYLVRGAWKAGWRAAGWRAARWRAARWRLCRGCFGVLTFLQPEI